MAVLATLTVALPVEDSVARNQDPLPPPTTLTTVVATSAPPTTAPPTTATPPVTALPEAVEDPSDRLPLPDAADPGVEAGRPVRDVGRAIGLPGETRSWDIAPGHLDDDGLLDLVMSYHGRVVAYVNRGRTLQQVFEFRGNDTHGCDVADVNDDGRGDIFCSSGAGHGTRQKRNNLFIQEDDLQFRRAGPEWGVDDPLGRGRHVEFVDLNRDGLPDLFVGNEPRRRDGRPSPNRTFQNVDGQYFREVRIGLTQERGALCFHAGERPAAAGVADSVLCGGLGPATPGQDKKNHRLFLFRPHATRRNHVRDHAVRLGVAYPGVRDARLVDLNRDGRRDLVVVQRRGLRIHPRLPNGRFGPVAFHRRLAAGRSVAVGRFDRTRGPDIYVVQGCTGGGNVRDVLLLSRGGLRYRERAMPQVRRGCGDTVEAADLDGDGRVEFIVGNGHWQTERGPIQVITLSNTLGRPRSG